MKNVKERTDAMDGRDELLTAAEVAVLYGCSTTSITNYVRAGLVPRPRRVGSRGVRWVAAEIRQALQTLPATGVGARRK